MSYSFSIPKTPLAEAPDALQAACTANSAGFAEDDFGNDQREGASEATRTAVDLLTNGYFDTVKSGVTVNISGHGRRSGGAGSAAPTMTIGIFGAD